jgi:LysM repeat protein
MAQGVYGAEEKEWQEIISSSYSGYRPPRIASPATADKASPEALEKQRAAENRSGDESVVEVPPPAAEDKAPSAVDRAADKTAQNAEDKKADAAKADDKKAEDKKADAAKADDKKAEDKKADAAKADDKKAEDKKADAAQNEELDYEIYKVQPGDTPGSIARKYYGKASMYEIIMRANPQIKDAKLIQIGTELKIPKL